jgi:integrase/recombinase XerD
MVKRTTKAAGINEDVSPQWLRHAHGSHAIERGATLKNVPTTSSPQDTVQFDQILL